MSHTRKRVAVCLATVVGLHQQVWYGTIVEVASRWNDESGM